MPTASSRKGSSPGEARENLSADARLLVERLRGFVDAAHSPGSARQIPGSPTAIDLREAWSAIAAIRAEIDAVDLHPDDRASRHALLDDAALEMARGAVGQTVESYRQAIQDLSHDIRSPLNSILLLSDSLRTASGESLGPAQRRQVDVLYNAAVTLVRLVNDIVDASRMRSDGKIPVARGPFALNEALDAALRLVSPLAEHRAVELEVHAVSGSRRVGDGQLLCRILINLVSNAIEAAGTEGRVRVRLDSADDQWLRAEVWDSGRDVDIEELRGLIVERGESYPRFSQGGWMRGLGLSIVSRLAGAANGTMSVERADGGTRFTVDLPFEVERSAAGDSGPSE